jgi:hypothetical protein
MGAGDGLVPFFMHVQEFVSQKPPKMMVVSACRANDVSCTDPVSTFDDSAGTGDVQMQLPYGFSGYLELRSADVLTALFYFSQPLLVEAHAKLLQVISAGSLDILASVTKHAVDTSKGLVILEAFDCTITSVGGIHFVQPIESRGIPFNMFNGLPTTEATVTVRDHKAHEVRSGFLET